MKGRPRGNIVPKRGLRHGDPCFPFIFFFCTEANVSLLNHVESQEKIIGMCVTPASSPVSHLIFSDDSLLFCKVELRECDDVMKTVKV